ncbi:MAG: FAD:protein FMN transferase, partial [Spirochaetaceae bacterium]
DSVCPLHHNPPEYTMVMDTIFNVTVASWLAPDWKALYDHVSNKANLFDHRDPNGLLYSLNLNGKISNAPELVRIIRTAVDISQKSQGAFDPTILPVITLWDIEHGGKLPSQDQITSALKFVDFRKISISGDGSAYLASGTKLDLGGIAKGSVVDDAAAFLDSKGYTNYLVEAGGDILIRDRKPDGSQWTIAIRSPRLPGVQITSPQFSSGSLPFTGLVKMGEPGKKVAIVTSGDYERFFVKDNTAYHHLIDPATGYPADGAASVTVIAPNCETADALATAAFVLGYEKGLALLESLPQVEGLIIRDNGDGTTEMKTTSGFPAIISINL